MTFRQKLGKPRKTDSFPAAANAKIEIRRNVLAAIGAKRASVFDGFAGAGRMYDGAWREAASYVGCDLIWYRDERLTFVADNRRVLRAIDLRPFNIFDLDAYGSPWEQAIIIAARRPLEPGDSVGLVLTEGSGLKLKFGGYPLALRMLAGVRPSAAGGASGHDELIDRAIRGLMARMKADTIEARWQAMGRKGSAMRYLGLVLARKKKAPAASAGAKG